MPTAERAGGTSQQQAGLVGLCRCKGHSGSPVWAENKGLLYLIGVHTGPWSIAKGSCADVVPAGAATDANRAVRVTTNMLDNIRKWKA